MNDYGWIGRFTHSICRSEDWSLNSRVDDTRLYDEPAEPVLFDADGNPLTRNRRAGFIL